MRVPWLARAVGGCHRLRAWSGQFWLQFVWQVGQPFGPAHGQPGPQKIPQTDKPTDKPTDRPKAHRQATTPLHCFILSDVSGGEKRKQAENSKHRYLGPMITEVEPLSCRILEVATFLPSSDLRWVGWGGGGLGWRWSQRLRGWGCA